MLLVVLLALFDIFPHASWLWMVPVMLVMYLMIVAASLVAACLVCIVRDFQKFIPLGMTFLLFTSGIFFDVHDIPNKEKAATLLAVNPLAFMIDAHRQVLMNYAAPDGAHLFMVGLGSLAVIAASILYMRRFNHYLALKVLA